jgi:hypothetical protein
MNTTPSMGTPTPNKSPTPAGAEVGERAKRATVVRLYNTNDSPLWDLKVRLLNLAEECTSDEYFAVLGGLCGAEVVIILGEEDAETGILAFDENGHYVEIPEIPLEWWEEKYDYEVYEWVNKNPEDLAKKVFEHYQKPNNFVKVMNEFSGSLHQWTDVTFRQRCR